MTANTFLDMNVVVYAFEDFDIRANVAAGLLAGRPVLSIQTLDEFAAVAVRKLRISWEEVLEALKSVREICPQPVPVTIETHEKALEIASKYGYYIFDALLIAAALNASCTTLYSEDMQDGQVIEGLTIRNPFRNHDRMTR